MGHVDIVEWVAGEVGAASRYEFRYMSVDKSVKFGGIKPSIERQEVFLLPFSPTGNTVGDPDPPGRPYVGPIERRIRAA